MHNDIVTADEIKKLLKQKNSKARSKKQEQIDKVIDFSSRLMRAGKFCNPNVPTDPDVLKAVVKAFEKQGFKVEVRSTEATYHLKKTNKTSTKTHNSLYFSIED